MLWAFFVLTFLSKTVYAQSNDVNSFIEPGPPGTVGDFTQNNVYVVGSQISVRWTSNFSELSLAIYQNNNASFRYLPDMKFVTATTFYRWTVNLMDFDINKGNVFFFDVFAEDGTGHQLSSHYFNISEGASSPTSASLSSSSSTISSTGLPTSSTLAATSITTLPTAGATGSSSGLNTGAKVGIGVGVSVGVIGAAVVALIQLLRIRRGKSEEVVPLQDNWYPMDLPNKSGGSAGGGKDEGVTAGRHRELNPQEMPAISEPQELPGG